MIEKLHKKKLPRLYFFLHLVDSYSELRSRSMNLSGVWKESS
jgi:hypothetical protein